MSSQRQIIALSILFAVTFVTYLGFSSVMDATLVVGASVFMAPVIWFFLSVTLFSIGTVIWRGWTYQVAGSLSLVASSFFFAPRLVHLGIIIVATLIIFGSLVRIRHELGSRLRFSLYRSALVGMSQVILALSLVISSQYYSHIELLSWDRLVPSFDLADGAGAWMLRIAGKFSPSLASLQNRNLSVDEFLMELRPVVEIGSSTETLNNGIAGAVRQAEILRSKIELSRLLGRDVDGTESMNQILSEALRRKIITFVSGNAAETSGAVSFLPFFLAILLFFTVYPFGSILAPLALSLAALMFTFLIRMGFITIKKVPAEREILI